MEAGESGNEALAGMDLSGIEALVGFHPCARGSVPVLGSLDVQIPRGPKRTPTVRSSSSIRVVGCKRRTVVANRGGVARECEVL